MRATRGNGVLEPWLARKRYKVAESLIPSGHRKGCIVDVGCGALPIFLARIDFSRKIGLDKSLGSGIAQSFSAENLQLIEHDIEKEDKLPLESNYCDVVTMLAVIEHLESHRLKGLFSEIYRILKPGGIYIMTTPAPWTEGLLRIMAKFRLVSSVEIDDHKGKCDRTTIFSLLIAAGFPEENVRGGYFELGLNLWAVVTRP